MEGIILEAKIKVRRRHEGRANTKVILGFLGADQVVGPDLGPCL
jgi:hypothetical protein